MTAMRTVHQLFGRILTMSICMIVVLSFVRGSDVEAAKKKEEPVSDTSQDVDQVLDTLNETLVENRNLRAQIKELRESFQNATVERNVLESQIRRLNREEKRRAKSSEDEKEKTKNETKGLNETIEGLEVQLQSSDQVKEEAEEKLKQIQSENERLRTLLERAVFEEERGQYVEMMKQADIQGQQAVNKVRMISTQNEGMRQELAVLHYDLGNIMFKSNAYEKAIPHYKRALELNPMDSWAHYNLGVLYDYHLKDDKISTFHYREYLKLKPMEEEAHAIRERLLDREINQHGFPDQPLRFEYRNDDKRTFQIAQSG